MKKALFKDTIIEIKKTKMRFLSIFSIVALGVAIFSGVGATADDMRISADHYFDQYNLFDFHMVSNLGITESDVEVFKNDPNVESVFATYSKEVFIIKGSKEKVFRVEGYDFDNYQNDNKVNDFMLIDGRLPKNKNECLIESSDKIESFDKFVVIGDEIKFKLPSNENYDDYFKEEGCKVVGSVQTPYYLSYQKGFARIGNGQLSSYLYVDKEVFNYDVYTDLYLTIKGAKELKTYGKEYGDFIDDKKVYLEKIGDERADIRYLDVYNKANDEYQDGLNEYNENKLKFDQEIADAYQKLNDAQNEYNKGRSDYFNNKTKAEKEFGDAKNKLSEAKKSIDEKEKELNNKTNDATNKLKKAIIDLNEKVNDIEKFQELNRNEVEQTYAKLTSLKEKLTIVYQNIFTLINKGLSVDLSVEENNILNNNILEYQNSIKEIENIKKTDSFVKLETYEKNKFILNNLEIAIVDNEINLNYLDIYDDEELLGSRINEINKLIEKNKKSLKENEDELFKIEKSINDNEIKIIKINNQDKDVKTWLKIKQDNEVELTNKTMELFNLVGSGIDNSNRLVIAQKLNEIQSINIINSDIENNKSVVEYLNALSSVEVKKARVFYLKQMVEEDPKVLLNYKNDINNGLKEITDKRIILEAEIAKANVKFDNALNDLNEAKNDIDQGYQKLKESEDEGNEELKKAFNKLVDAKEEIESLEDGKWYVLDRSKHYSYVDYQGTCDRMEAIAKVFPGFFFLVSALVCLTTMTRLVDEQRQQIGTLKALGYTKNQIIFKYLFYAGLASLLGSIVGLVLGMNIFPQIIYNTWLMLYDMPKMKYDLQLDLIAFGLLVSTAITMIAAFAACYKALKEEPSQLMRPKAPKLGKKILLERIGFIWNKFSFISKVTVRNLIRYKKRFFMTVVGIAGCTALLVAGFGIDNSINHIVEGQFGNVFKFNGQINYEDISAKNYKALEKKIIDSNLVDEYYNFYQFSGKLKKNDTSRDIKISVYDNFDKLQNLISLHDRKTQEMCNHDDDSIIITEKMAIDLNIKVGDAVVIDDDDINYEVKVGDIAENYLDHYVYISSDYYQKVFNKHPINNAILFKLTEENLDNQSKLSSLLTDFDEISGINYNLWIKDNFNSMIEGLVVIVAVLVVCAALLAFVVLINLTNVNISERIREIATLKVLGFNSKEVNSYIHRENLGLSFIGGLFGLLLGKALHLTIMKVVELDAIMFGRNINIISYIISFVLTLFFTYIVSLMMRKHLKQIPMVESLKSVE